MGRPGMAFSAITIAVEAIMYWAVTYHGTGFRLSTVGVIPMIVGAFGFLASAIIFSVSRSPVGSRGHSLDRQVLDSEGKSSSVHEVSN